jgi:hypothetical protein
MNASSEQCLDLVWGCQTPIGDDGTLDLVRRVVTLSNYSLIQGSLEDVPLDSLVELVLAKSDSWPV